MKKKFIFIFFLITHVGMLVYFIVNIVPILKDIHKLNTHYVNVDAYKGEVHYSLIQYRPEGWINPKNNELASKAIIISEDWSFYNHIGVDLSQIKDSIEDSIFSNKKIRGASTITQQLIKNLFLTNEKTLKRKLTEMFLSIYLESFVKKDRILEIYLNIIEYGENLYGIANAASYYFNKPFRYLSPKEAAFLAMLLPNPKRNAKSFYDKKLTPYAQNIIENILHKLTIIKAIDPYQKNFYSTQLFTWELN